MPSNKPKYEIVPDVTNGRNIITCNGIAMQCTEFERIPFETATPDGTATDVMGNALKMKIERVIVSHPCNIQCPHFVLASDQDGEQNFAQIKCREHIKEFKLDGIDLTAPTMKQPTLKSRFAN